MVKTKSFPFNSDVNQFAYDFAELVAELAASKLADRIKQPKKLPEDINSEKAAQIIGCKKSYLAQLRHKKKIPFYKNEGGRIISYKRSEMEAYRNSKRVATKSERVEAAHLAQGRKSNVHSN